MQKQTLRLTDKEIQALVKKVEQKQISANAAKETLQAKKYLPEAERILKVLNGLPDSILQFVYSNRYNRGCVTKQAMANILFKKDEDYETPAKQTKDEIESDIVLMAHNCKSLAELCTKLKV